MSISFDPLRKFMKEHGITYYYLANHGIEAPTLQRLRKNQVVTTKTINKLCKIMKCQPSGLIEFTDEND